MTSEDPNRLLTCVDINGGKHQVPLRDFNWHASAYAIVIKNDRILLSKQRGKYVLPGGTVEFGEMPDEAVVRETEEETGLVVAKPRLLACRSNLFLMPDIDQPVQSILLFYVCDCVSGTLSIAGLDEFEQQWTGMPEWVPLEIFDRLNSVAAFHGVTWWKTIRPMLDPLAECRLQSRLKSANDVTGKGRILTY